MYSYWAEFERPKVKEELAQVFEAKAADTLSGVLDRMVKMRDEVLERSLDQIRESIDKLTGAQARTDVALQKLAEAQARTDASIKELSQAQARTDASIKELSQAQARSEERLDRVEAVIEKLVQAQARSEERLGRVEAVIEKLVQAQARSEERLDRVEAAIEKLVQAQARSEERLDRVEAAIEKLAQAQARTDKAVEKLARQVGGLSETVGGDIEDIAYIVLHDVLRREFGWQVGVLQRTWKTWNGRTEEINVFGQAVDPAHPERSIWIIGEAKHNISMREVERFARQVERARQYLTGEIFPVCFCYRARPEVQERIKDLGLRLVFSYGRLD